MTELVEVNEMPKQGQFIAIWTYGGLPFAETRKWVGGKNCVLNPNEGDGCWIDDELFCFPNDVKFYICRDSEQS